MQFGQRVAFLLMLGLAERAIAGGHLSWFFVLSRQTVYGANQQEDDKGHDYKIDYVANEKTVIQGWCACLLGFSQAGIFLPGEADK